MSKRQVYGIDLGTTSSRIAHVNEQGEPVVLPNADGSAEKIDEYPSTSAKTPPPNPARRYRAIEQLVTPGISQLRLADCSRF